MSKVILSPTIGKDFYPERNLQEESELEKSVIALAGNATRWFRARPGRFQHMVNGINEKGPFNGGLNDPELREAVGKIRARIRTEGLTQELIVEAFALVRELSFRILGKRHFDVQVLGGLVLMHGMVAEMQTGEGKTLTATLPAATAALAGIPVHVITVNDYLAQRDAEIMNPLYESLGLRVGVVKQGMSPEDRRKAYLCDITYCTNNEVVFDYLKDRIALGHRPRPIQMRLERLYSRNSSIDKLLLRGLPFAIVDEADSVLIDEARTPLIISGPGNMGYEKAVYAQALDVARQLKQQEHFTLNEGKRSIELTEQGKTFLQGITSSSGGIWIARQWREELAVQALSAVYLFTRDRDYIVRDDKVQIVDEYTGRIMGDRSWERGLHQLIETKEGCELSSQNETLARMSYQRFFRRYRHLSGMTGTAREVARELWSVYRLDVVTVPTNKPVARLACPYRFITTAEEKWQEVVARIAAYHHTGRPVLVGTRSVAVSEFLSQLLSLSNLPHRVLNARQDKEEAEIIEAAGEKGRITVATNMAGRGTDIAINPEALDLGGLHVIATELHDTGRIDRQLFGRCGRQGDPGSFEAIVSLQDELFAPYSSSILGAILHKLICWQSAVAGHAGALLASLAQWAMQRKHLHVRRELLKMDDALQQSIAFSGRGE